MTDNQETTVRELVNDTLAWVNYGEPNPTDLIELTTLHYDVVAHNLGFKSDDETIVAAAEFRRDPDSDDPEADGTVCLVELSSAINDGDITPGAAELSFGTGRDTVRRFEDHESCLAAFYQWCEDGQIPS